LSLVHLGTEMNWLDFGVKRSKVKVTAWPNTSQIFMFPRYLQSKFKVTPSRRRRTALDGVTRRYRRVQLFLVIHMRKSRTQCEWLDCVAWLLASSLDCAARLLCGTLGDGTQRRFSAIFSRMILLFNSKLIIFLWHILIGLSVVHIVPWSNLKASRTRVEYD